MHTWCILTVRILSALVLAGLLWMVFSVPAEVRASYPPPDGGVLFGGDTTFYQTEINILTYPYERFLEPIYHETYNLNYQRLDWEHYNASGLPPTQETYTLLVLENDHLRVTVLPEVGGRIYELVYKATGNNEFYRNPVLKPTQWGPPEQGWWLAAGGIEWGLPVEEHGYEWCEPWEWSVTSSTAGVTVTVRDSTATDRIRSQVDLFLPTDRAYLSVRPRIENPTASGLSYKYWLNAMLAPGPSNETAAGYEFVFNAEQVSIHSTGDDRLPGTWPNTPDDPDDALITWPLYNGVDWSRLGNWDDWLGFFEYPQAAADFMGLYNHDAGEGVARIFPSAVARGAKGFAMGWLSPLPSSFWTDDGSSYVELHGGVAPTFWDSAYLAPGGAISWTEFWYPLGAIGGLEAATEDGALSIAMEGGLARVNIHPTQVWPSGQTQVVLWDRQSCEVLDEEMLPAFDPAQPHVASLTAGGRDREALAVAFADGNGQSLVEDNPSGCVASPLPARLDVHPTDVGLLVDVDEGQVIARSLDIANTGYGALSWSASVTPHTLTPTLLTSAGDGGEPLWLMVDTRPLDVGVYTATLTVNAEGAGGAEVLDSPQQVTVTAQVVPELTRLYLPLVARQ